MGCRRSWSPHTVPRAIARIAGRLDGIASDTDKATERADARLQTVLGQRMRWTPPGSGANDLSLAFEDAIREFALDHLMIGLRREHRSG
jgi:hypothetical protein